MTHRRRCRGPGVACALATLAFASVGYAASADGRRVSGDASATAATARLQALAARPAAPFPGPVLTPVVVPGSRLTVVPGIDDNRRRIVGGHGRPGTAVSP